MQNLLESYKKTITYASSLLNLPIIIFDENAIILYSNYPELSSSIFTPVIENSLRLANTVLNPQKVPIVKHIQFNLYRSIVPLTKGLYLYVGPVLNAGISYTNYNVHLHNIYNKEVLSLLLSIQLKTPHVTFELFINYILLLERLLTGKALSKNDLLISAEESYKPSSETTAKTNIYFKAFKKKNAFGEEIYTPLRLGNIAAVEKCFTPEIRQHYFFFNTTDLEEIRNLYIAHVSVCLYIAMECGLSVEHIEGIVTNLSTDIRTFSTPESYWHKLEELTLAIASHIRLCGFTETTYIPPIEQCLTYIKENIYSKLTLEQIAMATSIHPRQLQRLFKKELSMSPIEYITKEKLSEAAELLNHSDLTLSEITTALSFSSQSYFTKIFKEHYGQTPTKYRSRRK